MRANQNAKIIYSSELYDISLMTYGIVVGVILVICDKIKDVMQGKYHHWLIMRICGLM